MRHQFIRNRREQPYKCTVCGAIVTKNKLSVEMYHDALNDPDDYEMCGPCVTLSKELP